MAIANEGDSQSFSYTGGMQSLTVPVSGVYKLEVYGASGGNSYDGIQTGGKGGYAIGYKKLEKGTVLYVCCGQQGAAAGTSTTYNGGGKGCTHSFSFTEHYAPTYTGSSGGGATHMATVTGTIAAIGSANLSKILIVAAGGGGGYNNYGGGGNVSTDKGGTGGGTTGGSGTANNVATLSGGTQTGGNAFGQGGSSSAWWGDWSGAYPCCVGNGGGGGLYGGRASTTGGNQTQARSGAGGGSGYVGGVAAFTYNGVSYAPSMTNGQNTGNGRAVVTLVKKTLLPVVFNGTALEKIVFNGTEITSLVVNGVKLFMERMKRRKPAWNTSTRADGPLRRPI